MMKKNPTAVRQRKIPSLFCRPVKFKTSWYDAVLQQVSIYGIAAGYCLSASLLSIINKWAVMKFPYPGALTALQYFTSAAGVLLCGKLKILEHDSLDIRTMWRFLPAAMIFYLSLFTNTYSWALAYLISMTVDFVYIKHVVMTVGLNTWGLGLYNNLESLLLFPLELLIMGELKKIKHEITDETYWAISATGFTVLGIVNKLLTVVINLIIWDKHATVVGTVGLLICMAGGIMYQQSASNIPKVIEEVKAEGSEENQLLLEVEMNEGSNIDKIEVESGEPK